MSSLKIYKVTDEYIKFLRDDSKLSKVMDNKQHRRKNIRPYVGAAIDIKGFKYFIPFSSPKDHDYKRDKNKENFILDKNGDRIILKDQPYVIRMITNDTPDRKPQLLGTLKIQNMIPVPQNELISFNISGVNDKEYKRVLEKEYDYIRKNTDKINKNAMLVYTQKHLEQDSIKNNLPLDELDLPDYVRKSIPFEYAEQKYNEFCRLHTLPQVAVPKSEPDLVAAGSIPIKEPDLVAVGSIPKQDKDLVAAGSIPIKQPNLVAVGSIPKQDNKPNQSLKDILRTVASKSDNKEKNNSLNNYFDHNKNNQSR